MLSGNCGAYTALVDALEQKKECSDYNHKVEILRALSALMTKNPDLLDPKGLSLILFLINVQEESSVKRALLRWVKECCVMHELNRFVNLNSYNYCLSHLYFSGRILWIIILSNF